MGRRKRDRLGWLLLRTAKAPRSAANVSVRTATVLGRRSARPGALPCAARHGVEESRGARLVLHTRLEGVHSEARHDRGRTSMLDGVYERRCAGIRTGAAARR